MSLTLSENKKDDRQAGVAWIRERLGPRSIVLIGLMGAGKTAVGRRLASRLELPFVDADSEIETAAASTINEIFAGPSVTSFDKRRSTRCSGVPRSALRGITSPTA